MADDKAIATTGNYYALTGLVLGIVGIFFYTIGIISLLAVIFSSIGLSKTKDHEGKGKVPAIIGLVLGILFTVAYVVKSYGYF